MRFVESVTSFSQFHCSISSGMLTSLLFLTSISEMNQKSYLKFLKQTNNFCTLIVQTSYDFPHLQYKKRAFYTFIFHIGRGGRP